MALCRKGIVGVNLYGKVAIGLYELYKKWHLTAILFANGFSKDSCSLLSYDACKVFASQGPLEITETLEGTVDASQRSVPHTRVWRFVSNNRG